MTEPPAEDDRAAVRRRALWATVPHTFVLALAATATVTRSEATWLGVGGPVCPTGYLLGEHACPGCGLSRGTAMAVQGQWQESFAVNPGGFVVAALCLLGILLHLDVWRRGRALDLHRRLRVIGRWALLAGIALAWALRNFAT